jgi:hypothetical protein
LPDRALPDRALPDRPRDGAEPLLGLFDMNKSCLDIHSQWP